MERTSIWKVAGYWLALVRPLNLVLALFSVLLVCWLVGLTDAVLVWASGFTVLMVTAAGNMLNDVADLDTDRINRPDRPLVKQELPVGRVKSVWKLMMIAGIGVSGILLPFEATLLAMVNGGLLIWYSAGLKGTPLIGNVVVSWLLASVFLFTGLVADSAGEMLLAAMVVFFFSLPRELAKDACDEPGDRLAGYRTFPVAAGLPATRLLLLFLMLAAMLSGFYPLWVGKWGVGFLLVYLLMVLPLLTAAFVGLVRAKEPDHYKNPSDLLKWVIIPALGALIVDKLW